MKQILLKFLKSLFLLIKIWYFFQLRRKIWKGYGRKMGKKPFCLTKIKPLCCFLFTFYISVQKRLSFLYVSVFYKKYVVKDYLITWTGHSFWQLLPWNSFEKKNFFTKLFIAPSIFNGTLKIKNRLKAYSIPFKGNEIKK